MPALDNFSLPLIKSWQMAGALGRTLCVPLSPTGIDTVIWAPALLNILTSFPLFPYQVLGTSDGVTAGLDGVNRWLNSSSIVVTVTAGNPRSWAVFKNPATGYSYCIHAFRDGSGLSEVVVSHTSAFTGGSITARPTATDELVVKNSFFQLQSTTLPLTLSVWHTTDGQQTMVVAHGNAFSADSLSMQWFFGNVHNAPVAWNHPGFLGVSCFEHLGVSAHSLCGSGGGFPTVGEKPVSLGGGSFTPFFCGEGATDGISPDPVSTRFPLASADGKRYAQSFAVFVNSGTFVGIMGCWPDVLAGGIQTSDVWVAFAGVGTGLNGNSPDATRTRCCIGQLLYPWDGGPWSV